MQTNRLKVYQFSMWGKKFVVDVESGNFFEVDKSASEAIRLFNHYPRDRATALLKDKFGSYKAEQLIDKIEELKEEKLLFLQNKNRARARKLDHQINDLTLNIVNSCNLRCGYCWNKSGEYADEAGDDVMSAAVAYKAIDMAIAESGKAKDIVIDFYGGEPLLNYDLVKKVINYCQNRSSMKKGKRFRFLLATNGTLLYKERARFMINNGVDIAVSLDGPKKIQDKQRFFQDGRGSYDIIMDNIFSLEENLRHRLVARATFTPQSCQIVRTFKFLRSLGFDRIEICESEKAGYGLDESRATFFFLDTPEDVNRLKRLYYNLALFYTKEIIEGRLTYENSYFNRFFKQLSRLYHIQSIVGTCSAGYSQLAVDTKGGLYPCTAFVGIKDFKIGSVFKGLDKGRLREFIDSRITTSQDCQTCWAKSICQGCGSCYNINYFTTKDALKPDVFYCELFRYKTKLMIAMIAKIAENNPRLLDEVLIPEYYATRGSVQKR